MRHVLGLQCHSCGCNFWLEWFVWIDGTWGVCQMSRFGYRGPARCSMGSKRSLERVIFSLKSPFLRGVERYYIKALFCQLPTWKYTFRAVLRIVRTQITCTKLAHAQKKTRSRAKKIYGRKKYPLGTIGTGHFADPDHDARRTRMRRHTARRPFQWRYPLPVIVLQGGSCWFGRFWPSATQHIHIPTYGRLGYVS